MIELPQYDCGRIDGEITVDGALTDAAWGSADVIELLTTDTGEKTTPTNGGSPAVE